MAVSRNPYSDLNNEEIDAESPLTELVMSRLRDNVYSALTDPATAADDDFRVRLPERAKADVTEPAGKNLQTNGAGGFVLAAVAGGAAVDVFNGNAADDIFVTFTPALNIIAYEQFTINSYFEAVNSPAGANTFITGVVSWFGNRVSGNNFDIAVQTLEWVNVNLQSTSQDVSNSFTLNTASVTQTMTAFVGGTSISAEINITATTIEARINMGGVNFNGNHSENFRISA